MIPGIILTIINIILILYYNIKDINKYIIIIIINMVFVQLVMFKIDFYYAPTYYNFVFLLMIICAFLDFINKKISINNQNKLYVLLISYILLILFYILLLDVIRGVDPMGHLNMVKHYFWGILIFSIIVSKNNDINIKRFDKFILYLILLQAVIGWAQYLNTSVIDFFRVYNYSWRGNFNSVFDSTSWINNNIIIGTFMRMGNYGNIMGLLTIYLLAKKFIQKKDYFHNAIFITTVILSISSILFTGIRASFLTLSFGMMLIVFLFRRKYFWWLLLAMFIFYIMYFGFIIGLSETSIYNRADASNPLMRTLGGLFIFSDNFDVKRVTLVRSYYIFDMFLQKPLFGTGTYFKHAYSGISSPTDANLLFHVVEFGIVGFYLLLIPYIKFIRSVKYNKDLHKIAIVLISVMLVQTIVDNGLFYFVANILVWIIFASNYVASRKNNINIIE